MYLINETKNTIILKDNNQDDIFLASKILKDGGLVALPTETVYGLAAKGLCINSVKKIYAAKNRPINNPLILHVSSTEQAEELFDFSSSQNKKILSRFKLLTQFWPGALTIIAKRSKKIPSDIALGLDTVAVRMPNHETALSLISLVGEPLAMPSANISTRPSSTSFTHVLKTLNGRIDAIVASDNCKLGIESTVVSIEKEVVHIYRLGVISKEEIEECLKEKVFLSLSAKEKPLSPGQSFLHYSPKVSAIKCIEFSEIVNYWQSENSFLMSEKQYQKAVSLYSPKNTNSMVIRLSDSVLEYTTKFYSSLYSFEDYPNKTLILVLPEHKHGLWLSIREKMFKAASLPF